LFGAQRNLDADALLVLAQKLKLDMKRTQAALARHVHRPAIEADQDLAEALQVEAVPQFFINGRRLVGAQPIGRFEQIIGERLADAEQLMAEAKVPPARLYDELMKDARAPVELERKDIGPPPASSPSRGPADAKVVLQVFSDFECPYCKRLAPVLDALSREYPRDLRVVWRHLPLPIHANAKVAAMAALEAGAQLGPDGFWRMHDLIYRFLGRPGGVPNPETLQRYAGQLGLDLVRFREAIEQGRHEAAIARDIVTALGSGITATPSVVVNGYFINGLMPLERWRRLMKRILAETSEGGRQPDPPSSVTK
jgi:protein-disulfide isomerase